MMWDQNLYRGLIAGYTDRLIGRICWKPSFDQKRGGGGGGEQGDLNPDLIK